MGGNFSATGNAAALSAGRLHRAGEAKQGVASQMVEK